MGRKISGVLVVLAFVVVAIGIGTAQEQTETPDPVKEIAALKAQIAQMQQPKQMSQAEQTKAAQAGYAEIFKQAKEKAGDACKAVSGRLRVTVASDGKASVSCEM